MECISEGCRKRRRKAVPPEPNKKLKGDAAGRIRNDETAVAHLTKYEGVFQAAGIHGFVGMDRCFSTKEAEQVCKGMERVGMTPSCMVVKYKGKLFSISNQELESFFDVKTSLGGGDVPLPYDYPEITRDEASTFLKSNAEICKQGEEKKQVKYSQMRDEERRMYVEYFIKWVLLESGYQGATIRQISIAKAVLEGSLHPLRVWKRGVVGALRVRGLPTFPSVMSYVVANVFATICLEEQEVEEGERESRDEGSQILEILREQEEDSRQQATAGISNSDDESGESQATEITYYRARRMARELREGSGRQIHPPSPSEASVGGGPPEHYLYPPLVAERDAEDLTQYDTFEKRMAFLERPLPDPDNPSDWLFEFRTHRAMVRILATEIEEGVKTKRDTRGLQGDCDRLTASSMRLVEQLESMTKELEQQSRRIQELEGVERKKEELEGHLTRLRAYVATKAEVVRRFKRTAWGFEAALKKTGAANRRTQANATRLLDKVSVGKEEADKRGVELRREIEVRDQYIQALEIEVAEAQKAKSEILNQSATREICEVRQQRVCVSREAYEGWEFRSRELRTKLESTAKLLLELTRENEQLRADAATGSMLENVRRVSSTSWAKFNRFGRMRRDALEIDEAMGLETLTIILTTERVSEGNIRTTDWDRVWKHIPLRIRYMIPFFMWLRTINVEDEEDLYYRVGGRANARITQILLAELDRDHSEERYYLSILAIEEAVNPSALPRAAHREHSFDIQRELHQILPRIMRQWAHREVIQSRDEYTLPRLQVLLHAAGWTGNAFNPYYTSHEAVSDEWMSFVRLVPSPALAHLVFPYFYEHGKDPEDIARVGGLGRLDDFPFDVTYLGEEGGVWTNNKFWEVYTPTHDVMSWMERCLQNYAIGGYFGLAMGWKQHDAPPDFNQVYTNRKGKSTGLYVVPGSMPIYYSRWQHDARVRVRLAGEEDAAEGCQVQTMTSWVSEIHDRGYDREMLKDPRIFKWYCCVRSIVEVIEAHPDREEVVIINRDGMMPDGGRLLERIFYRRGPSAVRMYNIIIGSQVLKGENPDLRTGTPPGVPVAYLMIRHEPGFPAAMGAEPRPGTEEYLPEPVVAGETREQRDIRRIRRIRSRNDDFREEAIRPQEEREVEIRTLAAERDRRRTLQESGVGEDEVGDEEIRRDRLEIRRFREENLARSEAMIAREEGNNVAGPSNSQV